MSEVIEMVGFEGTEWDIFERATNQRNGKARWKARCRKHPGQVFLVIGCDVRANKSKACKRCAIEKAQSAIYGGTRRSKHV